MGFSDGATENLTWFCLRSQPKHEHIGAMHLRQSGIEAFAPRIRFKRKTRRGPVWFTEALFPTYLFARFNWQKSLRQVHHIRGVTGVVHFGTRWPTIPDADIELLRSNIGENEIRVLDPELEPGAEVQIAAGPLEGIKAVVTRLIPSNERVQVLLDFLGRQSTVELDREALLHEESPRGMIFNNKNEDLSDCQTGEICTKKQ